jgi:hypothetical protein
MKNSCLWTRQDNILCGVLYLCDIEYVEECAGRETLAARGLEEHVRVFLIFAIIVSFMLFTVFTLANVLYFEEFMIHNHVDS